VDYDAILMLRRQLGNFRAESFARLRFPVYDFAAVWYLHQTGRLTEERLSSLFPHEEINFVIALAEIVKERPVVRVAQAVLGLFDQHLGERWTLFRRRRGVDRAEIEEIQAMDPGRDLVPEMPRLFAMDLNAALATPGAPPRIILLADGHEVFSDLNEDSGIEGDRDRWLRYLLGRLHLRAGIVPVITSRQELDWANRARYAIPTGYLDPHLVGHFSDADATTYLAKAGVDDSGLRARLCDYARIAPDEIHPLYAGLGADIVVQAIQQGRRLRVEDFPDRLPDAQNKPRLLVERLLREASRDVGYAVRSLAAARAFDRELFEKLGSWERTRYSATDAAFDTLTQFSFVWGAQSRGSGWYSIHTLLRRIFRERGDERLREADAVLEAIYRERSEAGDTLTLAEVAYHAYQLEPERGLQVWADAFERARMQSQYALCEALRTVGAEFKTVEPGWRARMAREEGEYLQTRFRHAEAAEVLRASVSASDEAIRRAPNDAYAYSNKGVALRSLGNSLAALSRYGEAESAYTDAVAAFDAALSRAPGDPLVYNNKGNALSALGGLLASLSRHEEAERLYNDAIA
jgi:tetratricopeptide (TPR) repeat protein